MYLVEIQGQSSRELFFFNELTIFNVKAQVPPRVAAGTNNITQMTVSFRFHHSSGTGLSSADFFFEMFGKKTLQHRASIVIGLTPAFLYGGIGGGRGV